jgi:hypothetical protein
MFRWMPPMPDVAETLWHLSDLGVWIRLITHRLYVSWGHAIAVGDTVHWLDEVGIPYRDLCFLGQKPEVEADAYLEDAPHNVRSLRAAGNTVIVFDQPYNRDLDGPRVGDWPSAGALVVDLLAAHGPVQQVLPHLDRPGERLTRPRIRPAAPLGDPLTPGIDGTGAGGSGSIGAPSLGRDGSGTELHGRQRAE